MSELTGVLAGAFDVLHPGYIKMFKIARSNCDWLIVLLNSCENLEDPKKIPPILSVEDRMERLLALQDVDEVIVYHSEEDLAGWLKKLKPRIRFLGEDYVGKSFTGDDLNIPIFYLGRDHGWSTTKLKKMIAEQIKRMEEAWEQEA